jgi:hypothetical protein
LRTALRANSPCRPQTDIGGRLWPYSGAVRAMAIDSVSLPLTTKSFRWLASHLTPRARIPSHKAPRTGCRSRAPRFECVTFVKIRAPARDRGARCFFELRVCPMKPRLTNMRASHTPSNAVRSRPATCQRRKPNINSGDSDKSKCWIRNFDIGIRNLEPIGAGHNASYSLGKRFG